MLEFLLITALITLIFILIVFNRKNNFVSSIGTNKLTEEEDVNVSGVQEGVTDAVAQIDAEVENKISDIDTKSIVKDLSDPTNNGNNGTRKKSGRKKKKNK